jgi:hypothetical protein
MILVLTLLFLALMSVMAIGLLSAALSENQTASANRANLQALYFADAGIEEAKMRLTPGPNAITITPATNWRVSILSGHTQAEVPTLDPTYGKAPPDYTATETTSNYSYTQTIQTGANPVAWGWARIHGTGPAGRRDRLQRRPHPKPGDSERHPGGQQHRSAVQRRGHD